MLLRAACASAAGLMMQQVHRAGVRSTRRFQRWQTSGRVVLNHVNLAAASLWDAKVRASGEQNPSASALKTSTKTSSVAASAGDTVGDTASADVSMIMMLRKVNAIEARERLR